MRYHVTLADRTYVVEVDGDQVSVDGIPYSASVAPLAGTPLVHLQMAGRSIAVPVVGESGGLWTLLDGGDAVELEVLDDRTRHIRSLIGPGRKHGGAGVVKAPMPGLVVRVLVQAGDTVTPGQGLVVLEAMKMENELKAVGAGVVQVIHAQPGQAVEKGAVLVELAGGTS